MSTPIKIILQDDATADNPLVFGHIPESAQTSVADLKALLAAGKCVCVINAPDEGDPGDEA